MLFEVERKIGELFVAPACCVALNQQHPRVFSVRGRVLRDQLGGQFKIKVCEAHAKKNRQDE